MSDSLGGGLTQKELEEMIYELHAHQGLRHGQIASTLPMNIRDVKQLYANHMAEEMDGAHI